MRFIITVTILFFYTPIFSQSHFECTTKNNSLNFRQLKNNTLSDGDIYVYRIAIMTSNEYSQDVLNGLNISSSEPDSVKKNAIIGHLNDLLSIINSVYERDLSIRLELVSNNENVIFLDASSNQITQDLSSNQIVCDNLIGSANYDIGHALTYQWGGNYAIQGSVCTVNKAKGVTGALGFDNSEIRTMIHEIGHQFGASHTFNTLDGVSYPNPYTGVEIGSGETIMSYRGASGPLFFHSISIQEIHSYIQSSGSCASIINNGNITPTCDAGNNYTIPKQTPFQLVGTSFDSNGDDLFFTWEQIDSGNAYSPPLPMSTTGPSFIWKKPTNSIKRYLPNINSVKNGFNMGTYEMTSYVNRDYHFNFIAKDNNGGVCMDNMTVTVDENSGPFEIVSNNNDITIWYSGSLQTILWDVADTNSGSVNTPTVDIFYTDIDGNFSIELANSVPNVGHYSFIVPEDLNTNGKYLVKGHNNIFFDVNNGLIEIANKKFLVNIDYTEKEKNLCLSDGNTVLFNFVYNSFLDYNETVSFSANGLPGATISFSPSSTNTNNTLVTMTISGLSSSNIGTNLIEITASDGSLSHTNTVTLNVFDDSLNTVLLLSPTNGASNISDYTFLWDDNNNALDYLIEISSDIAFSNIIDSAYTSSNSYTSTVLDKNTTYYWRVKPSNYCTAGNFSSLFNFTTQSIYTYIPDDNFEQAIIDLGYDDTLDDYVLTDNINNVKSLSIYSKSITDLTGISDFTYLQYLVCDDNNISNIDLSNLIYLSTLSIGNNPISSIDILDNTLLYTFSGPNTNISWIDFSNSFNLHSVYFPHAFFEDVDLSNNPNLFEVNFKNNNLILLDIRNGNNINIPNAYFRVDNNPNLSCVFVDDSIWSENNWTSINYGTSGEYVENDADCDYLSTTDDNTIINNLKVFPNPVNNILHIKSSIEINKISIFSLTGQLIKDFNNTDVINLSDIKNGLYIIIIATDNGLTYRNKIIKI